tara:strand:- start:435 stop:716 length:282 start_codon:yes stop_codon:yes gene_type:complete
MEIQMPNDLTIADVQQMIRSELANAVAEVRQQQPLATTTDNQTTIDYRAVCDYLSGEIFNYCMTSNNQDVRRFGRDLAVKLGERFNIADRWNV